MSASTSPANPTDELWLDPEDAPSYTCNDGINDCAQFPEVAQILGHSAQGHRLLKVLSREYGRYGGGRGVTPALLTELTDADLLGIRQIGSGTIAWFRHRMQRLGMPQGAGDGRLPVWLPLSTWQTLTRLLEAPTGGPPELLDALRTAREQIIEQTSRRG